MESGEESDTVDQPLVDKSGGVIGTAYRANYREKRMGRVIGNTENLPTPPAPDLEEEKT